MEHAVLIFIQFSSKLFRSNFQLTNPSSLIQNFFPTYLQRRERLCGEKFSNISRNYLDKIMKNIKNKLVVLFLCICEISLRGENLSCIVNGGRNFISITL